MEPITFKSNLFILSNLELPGDWKKSRRNTITTKFAENRMIPRTTIPH